LSPRICIALGAFLAGLAVAIGAFGAHWLKDQVPNWYPDEIVAARMLDTWEVGVRYQMYSALGMIAAGLWASLQKGRSATIAASLFLVGVVVFSGLLYLLVLTGLPWLGAIVPLGGLAMIAGWLWFAWQVLGEAGSGQNVD